MIKYFLKKNSFNIDYDKNFIFLVHSDKKLYKSDFSNIQELVEFLDKNILDISEIYLDGNQFILFDGDLHSLFRPAKYTFSEFSNTMSSSCYINGEMVYDESFRKIKSFHDKYEELYSIPDYNRSTMRQLSMGNFWKKRIKINLEYEREKEIRKKKFLHLLK